MLQCTTSPLSLGTHARASDLTHCERAIDEKLARGVWRHVALSSILRDFVYGTREQASAHSLAPPHEKKTQQEPSAAASHVYASTCSSSASSLPCKPHMSCTRVRRPQSLLPPRQQPRLLVSACLLGQPVCYHGGAARSCRGAVFRASPAHFILDVLWRRMHLLDCVAICPEVDVLRLPVPRPPLRLVQRNTETNTASCQSRTTIQPAEPWWQSCELRQGDRAVLRYTPQDVKQWPAMCRTLQRAWAGEKGGAWRSCHAQPCDGTDADKKRKSDACVMSHMLSKHSWLDTWDGVLLKAKSPSCGVGDARVYRVGCQTEGGSNSKDSADGEAAHRVQAADASPRCEKTYEEDVGMGMGDGFFVDVLRSAAACGAVALPPLPVTSESLLSKWDTDAERRGSESDALGDLCVDTSLVSFLHHVLHRFEVRQSRACVSVQAQDGR